MNYPPLPWLQFVILSAIQDNPLVWVTGKVIRATMAEDGVKRAGPAFYQIMGRIEEAKLVEGENYDRLEERQKGKQRICERRYKLTDRGIMALDRTRRAYGRTKCRRA